MKQTPIEARRSGELRRLAWVVLAVCLFGALMSTLLTRAKLHDGLSQIIEARVLSGGRELARSVERAQGIGLRLSELDTLPALIERHRRADPLIGNIDVFDDGGRIISSSDHERAGRSIPDAVRRAARGAAEGSWSVATDEGRVAGITLRTGYGLVIGHIGLQFAQGELGEAMAAADHSLMRHAVFSFGAAALASLLALWWFLRGGVDSARAPWRLAACCLLPLALAMAGFGVAAQHTFEQQLLPQAARKAEALGSGIASLFTRAVSHGFDFAALNGVDQSLAELRAAHPELAFAAALDSSGEVRYRDGELPETALLSENSDHAVVPLLDDGRRFGSLVLGIDPQFVRGLLTDMALDVAVVLLVALVLASELARHVIGSVGSHAGTHLPRIRAPVFSFILAEELTRPCLPGYVGLLASDGGDAAAPLVIGLPIAIFMLIVALGQPALGRWSERVGRRQALVTGALAAALGFAGTALAQGLWDLILWRSLSALGYALVFAAGQGYVLDHAGASGRTRGFAVFVGAIMAATVCGPSIGGILADHLGQRATFAVSAALCLLSVLPMRALPRRQARAFAARGSTKGLLALLGNGRFAALTLFAAIPAKILLIGVLFYLVPLYVVELGYGQAMAGRLIMLYGVLMVLLVPVAASRGEGFARRVALITAGLGVSGAGGLVLASSPELAGLFALVALLGIGQALSISAQAALVGELCADVIARVGEDAVYGAYRMLERLGNVAGPLIAAALLTTVGFSATFLALGVLSICCALALRLMLWHSSDGVGGAAHAPSRMRGAS